MENKHAKESQELIRELSNKLNSSFAINAWIELIQKQLKELSKLWIDAAIESFDNDIVTRNDSTYLELRLASFINSIIEKEKNGLKAALISRGLPSGSIISDFQSSIVHKLTLVKGVSIDIITNEIENHNIKIERRETQPDKINEMDESINIKNNILINNSMKQISKIEKEELATLIRLAERYITSSHKVKGSTLRKWSKRSLTWLKNNYSETDYPNEFILIPEPKHNSDVGLTTVDVNRIQKKLSVLIKTQNEIKEIKKSQIKREILQTVFIVHGRDHSIKEEVARFIDKLKLKPVILHEQPNKGRTVIEKFIEHSDVGFAIILLTPDDKGGLAGDAIENFNLRARQNVIFELGYFIGKLGRDKVCALYVPGVEIPSDYSGILFIQVDHIGNWKIQLAKEIKSSGIKVDLNNIT